MLAAARFAVMSLVILPLLPEGPFGPAPGIRPRELWMLVLLFSGMSFVGSSRNVSADRQAIRSRDCSAAWSPDERHADVCAVEQNARGQAAALATGAVAASTILFARVAVAVAILDATLLPVLARYLAAPFVVSLVMLALPGGRCMATTSSRRR